MRSYLAVLQRAVSTYKFKLGVKRAVKSGARVRAVRIIRHGLQHFIRAAGEAPDDYLENLLRNDVTAGPAKNRSAKCPSKQP